jgi:lycopene cyclase domain-containing protein
MHFTYLISLLVVIGCLLSLDFRYKLAFWNDKKRTLKTIGISWFVFIIWDLCGIRFGIFLDGISKYSLPVQVLPQFPIEEFFFLFILCYVTLILYQGGTKWLSRI